ncbi:MAG TPA: hypothetical protein VGH34_09310 [Vicinamibacterales bacterium]|jgi:hypothetical protein
MTGKTLKPLLVAMIAAVVTSSSVEAATKKPVHPRAKHSSRVSTGASASGGSTAAKPSGSKAKSGSTANGTSGKPAPKTQTAKHPPSTKPR